MQGKCLCLTNLATLLLVVYTCRLEYAENIPPYVWIIVHHYLLSLFFPFFLMEFSRVAVISPIPITPLKKDIHGSKKDQDCLQGHLSYPETRRRHS